MIKILVIALVCSSAYCSSADRKYDSRNAIIVGEDTTFRHHFYVLDSVVRANPDKNVYACCTQSIKFMEVKTGINASSDGTLLGKLTFSKEDLQKWHAWYNKKYKKQK